MKPFSTPELLARVASSLRGVELERQLRERAEELNRALQALRQAESELVHGEKMKALGRLSAGVLHEANNPLTFAKA
ncbi:MAG: hybrid sensor histidine kinase/response regulator, partial [Planctomycetota bacterium]